MVKEIGRSWAARWAQLVTEHRLLVSLAGCALAMLMFAGMSRLGFNTDYKVFFAADNPQLQAFEDINKTFSKNETVFFTVYVPNDTIFRPENLQLIAYLTAEAWQIPHSARVDSITNYQHTTSSNDELLVTDLVPAPKALTPAEVERVRAIALGEPELRNKLIAADGRASGVSVTLQLPEGDAFAPMQAVIYAEKLVERVRSEYPKVQIALTGLVPVSAAYPRAAQADTQTLLPIMIGIVFVVLLVQLRSLATTLLSLVIVVLSSAAAFGAAGWFGILLTSPAVMAPLVILAIAIAECVHIIMATGQAQLHTPSQLAAVSIAIKKTFWPVVLTSVTDVVGFLGLNFASSPPYRDFGNIAALGAMIALVLSLTVLPAALTVLPRRWGAKPPPRFLDRIDRSLTRSIALRGGALAVGLIVVTVAVVPFATRLQINDHIIEYFDKDNPIRRDSELTLAHLTGIYDVEFKVASGVDDGIADPDYLQRLDRFTQWLRQQPEVVAVGSFSDTMKSMNRSLHADDQAFYRIPASSQEAAQILLLYEYSLPYGRNLNDRIDVRKSATRVVATLGRLTTAQVIALKERGESWLHSNGFAPDSKGAGMAVMFSYLSHHNIESMLSGTTYTLLLIAAVLWLRFRRIGTTTVAVGVNMIPLAVSFGIWGAAVSFVNTAASMACAVAFGLIVDGTIHLASVYEDHRSQGLSPDEAMRSTLGEVVSPIIAANIALLAGFLLLTMSEFRMNSDLGLLTALMIFIGLLYNLIVLPAFLLLLDRRTASASVMARDLVQSSSQ